MTTRRASSPPDIPGYRHQELLGTGGFADVFLYEQVGLGGRKVGVKVLLEGLRADAQQAFEREASVMAKLSNHPNIVSIFDAGMAPDGRAFLVMEYCPPPHLGTLVRTRPFPVAKALDVIIQIAGAAETAHAAGILHRDIKPANILFTEFQRPALTDFGIAASTLAGHDGRGVGVSVPWAPPEQLSADRPMAPSGDVWSLAATLYTVITGRSPFHVQGAANDSMSMGQRIVNGPLPPLRRDDVPESLENVIRVAMNKRPDQRYPTALEFARALQQIQLQLRYPMTVADVRTEQGAYRHEDDEDAGGTRFEGFVDIDPDAPSAPGQSSWPSHPSSPSASSASTSPTGSTASGASRDMTGLTMPAFDRDIASADLPPIVYHGRGSITPDGPVDFTGPAIPELDGGASPSRVPARFDEPRGPITPEPDRTAAAKKAAVGVLAAVGLTAATVGGYAFLQSRTPSTTSNATAPTGSAMPKDAVGTLVPKVTQLSAKAEGGAVVVSWTNPSPSAGDGYLYRVVDPAKPRDYVLVSEPRVTVPTEPGRTCVEVVLRRSSGRASDPVAECAVTP